MMHVIQTGLSDLIGRDWARLVGGANAGFSLAVQKSVIYFKVPPPDLKGRRRRTGHHLSRLYLCKSSLTGPEKKDMSEEI